MSDYYLGEVRMFAGDYAPADWAFCNGQLLPINGNETLYSLLGTTYGGDGQTTFGLPDMRGRVPVSMGTPATGTNYILGQAAGTETVALVSAQMPAHTHTPNAQLAPGSVDEPTNAFWSTRSVTAYQQSVSAADLTSMSSAAIGSVGGSQAHENMMPFMPLSFIIALNGTFPITD